MRAKYNLILFFLAMAFLFSGIGRVTAAPIVHNVSSSTEWNVRFDGSAASANFGKDTALVTDVNNNGRPDFIFTAFGTAFSGANSGSIYIIYDELWENITGSGNTIDLNSAANFSLRIDGTAVLDAAGIVHADVGDLDGDEKTDLVIPVYNADNTGANSGSAYILYNTLLDDFAGTGNTISLANAASYNVRIDGAAASDLFGVTGMELGDFDNDGKDDILAGTLNDKMYLISSSIFEGLTGTGNTLGLATATNYSLRLDGENSDFINTFGLFSRFLDLDDDGKEDLFVLSPSEDRNGRTDSGSVYVLYNTFLDDFPGTGNVLNMALATSYNIRIEGSAGGELLGFGGATVANIDQDDAPELILGALSTDIVRSNAGAVYIMEDTLFASLNGTGNLVDMANSSNYLVRIDGANVNENLVKLFITLVDFDNDGLLDIISSAQKFSDLSGSVIVIPNNIFSGFSGSGNTVDLATEEYIEFKAAAANDNFGSAGVSVVDIDGDGSLDILVGAPGADNNSRSASGSAYLIYNFPHDLSTDAASGTMTENTFTLTGDVAAPDSITLPAGVQYNIDDALPNSETWNDCSATDGTFDTANEAFTCTVTGLSHDNNGAHTVYLRAVDTNGSYTPAQNYTSFALTADIPDSPSGGSNPTIRDRFRNPEEEPSEPPAEDGEDGEDEQPPEGGASNFRDVHSDDWFAPFVTILATKGILEGYRTPEGAREFGPSRDITRAELVKILVKVLFPEFIPAADATSEFNDTSGHWAAAFIAKATSEGWINGYADGHFAPDDPVNRAEAAKILTLAFGLTLPDESNEDFPDVLMSDWFAPFVWALRNLGIVQGYPDGFFHPESNITRAEMSKMIVETAEKTGTSL